MIRRLLLATGILCALSLPVGAQNAITQEGTTLKDAPVMMKGNNRARQGATVNGAPSGQTVMTGDSVVGGRCDYSDPIDVGGGYYRICLDARNGRIVVDGTKLPVHDTLKIEINGNTYYIPSPSTITGSDVSVPNNVALKAVIGVPNQRAVRLGFYVPGDGGLATYNWFDGACPRADDGEQVQPPGASGCWWGDFTQSPPSVLAWGAKCDNGTTDDYVPINNALTSHYQTITGPDVGVCRTSQTIVVPGGSTLRGRNTASLGVHTLHPNGFTIKCDLDVSPCIKLSGGDSGNDHSALVNMGVDRVDGSITPGVVGVQLDGGMYVVVDNVGIYRSAVGLWLYDRNGPYGVAAYINRVVTCGITGTDIEIDGWREVRVNQSRFGCNGNLDVAHNEYILLHGGHGDGPNSVYFNNSQFNNGSGAITDCLMRWREIGGGQDGPTSGWVLSNVHVEQAKSIFCSDANLTNLNGLQVSNSKFYGGYVAGASFFRLDPATKVNSLNFNGNNVTAWGDFTLNPPAAMSGVLITGNEFITTGTGIDLTGMTGATAVLSGNRWQSMALRGDWSGLNVSGTGGLDINTTTGYVNLDIPGLNQYNCAAGMGLYFGNANNGMAYSSGTPICNWQRKGDLVTVAFYLGLTNKGTAFGNATIRGLPFQASYGPGVGSVTLGGANMTSLTGPMYASSGAASKEIKLYKQATNDRGFVEMTNADFTNTSIIQGVLSYMIDPGPLVLPTTGP